MGDEPLNPYLPGKAFQNVFGHSGQDINTDELYEQVIEKYDVFHIIIDDDECSSKYYMEKNKSTWGKYLDGQHLFVRKSDDLPEVIHDIVMAHIDNVQNTNVINHTEEGISW